MSISLLIPFDLSFNLKENTNFTQYAYDISGAESGGLAGQSISKNLAGDIIAVGAPLNSGGGTARGEVRVYQKNNNSWLQLGADLNGTKDNEEFGHSVDLNGDGTILGVGSKDTSNNLIVYKYDGSAWNQYGNNIHLVNNNISYNSHSLTPEIKVKLNKEGNKLVTMNKYNVTNQEVAQVTATHTSPYVTHGCTCNFDFRTNSSSGVTDDIGDVVCDYIGTSSTTSDGLECDNGVGTSFSSTSTKYARIQSGLTYGQGSYEFYLKFNAGVDWCTLFDIRNSSSERITLQARTSGNFYMFSPGGAEITISTTTKNTGSYHHFVFTISSSKQYNVYIDGELKGTASFGGSLISAANTGNNGTNFIGCERLIRGGIDGYYKFWRYYHGKVLSQSEVTDLYNDRDDTSTATGRDGTAMEGTNTITTTVTTNYEEELVQAYEYSSPSWNQIGNTIESSSLHDLSGGDIAINDEGNMIAIGYPHTNSATGTTKVFKYDTTDNSWNQVGSNIDGSATGDNAGTAVVIDGSGDLVAIGSPFANITLSNTVTTTTINGVQQGTEFLCDSRAIYDTGLTERRRQSNCAISGDGTRIFTGGEHGPLSSNPALDGTLKIADWDGAQWNITLETNMSTFLINSGVGDDNNEYRYSNFAYSVSSSYSGNTLAVGAPNGVSTSVGLNPRRGAVYIFNWDGSQWNFTAEIRPPISRNNHGHHVNLNKSQDPDIDGTLLLIGDYKNGVTMYGFNGTNWVQKGQQIMGGASDYIQSGTCINGDGNIFAIGSYQRNRVDVYEWNASSSTWVAKGSRINHPSGANSIEFGAALSMTGDGLTIIIGSVDSRYGGPENGNGNTTGEVYVYEWDGSDWQQKGQTITNDGMGHSVTVNNDGTVLAFSGVNVSSDNYSEAGKVLTYQWNGSDWEKFGAEYYGEGIDEHLGYAVALNYSGSHLLAVGKHARVFQTGLSTLVTTTTNYTGGKVNVYKNSNDSWNPYGNVLEGQADNDQFGTSLDMASPGNILAVGAPNANAGKGNINIYQYNETDSSWNQLGGDLSGTEVGDLTGTSVKLNQTGTEVSVGEPQPPTTSTSSDDATEIATFLSGDGNRQYVLIRINNGVGRRDGFISYTSAFNLSYLNNNYLITTSDETFDGIDITLISDASVPSVTGTNATIMLPFGDPNETTTGLNVDALVFISTSGGSGGSYYHSPHLVNTAIGNISTSSSDDSYFLVENTDYPSTKNLGKVRTFELSHTLNYEANTFQSSYLDGFLDISGGELRTRNADDHLLIGGDASMSGNVFVKGNETIENKNVIVSSTLTDISFSQLENTNFTQYAYDISGAESAGLAGHSISTSASGDIIAVGAPLNSGGGTARGEVRVYQKNNDSWLQLGNDLNGAADNEEFGHSVDLNGDGTILAVGTKDISHNTLVYKYDSGSWGLYGNSIYLNNNLNPRYETSLVANSISEPFAVSFDFRGTDYSAGNIPFPYSDNTGNSRSSTVGSNIYIDSNDGLTGGGNFICTTDNIQFNYIEIYYYATSSHNNTRLLWGENDDKSDYFELQGTSTGFYFYIKVGGQNKMKWYGEYPSNKPGVGAWNHLFIDPTLQRFWISGSGYHESSNTQFHTTNWTNHSITKVYGFLNNRTDCYCRFARLLTNTGWSGTHRALSYNNRDVVNYGYDTVLIELNRENGSTKPKLNKTGNKLTILNELQYADLVSNGFVQSYQYSESDASWNYLGNKIESASVNDISGGDIAINDEGNMIAIGYPQTNSATGTTKVFKYDTTDSSWNQIGSNIDGSATGDHAGTSVVIDGSGDLVAIGSPFAGDATAGEINVYQNVDDTWTLYGNKIQGQADNDQFGTSIDMTPAGNILAVGAVNANGGKGNVNIYQYNETDSSWNQLGGDLSGAEVGDLTGTSVKLNKLGTEVSVGEPQPPTPSTTTYGAHEVGTFLSGDGNRQYVLLRLDQDNITDSKVAFTEYVTDHPNLALINNDYLLAVGDDTFDGVDITLLSDTVYAIQTSNAAYIYFVFGNSDITTGQNIEYNAGVGTFQGSSNNNYHNIYFRSTNYSITSATGNEMVFVLENTDYPSTKNLGKVRTFEIEHTKIYEHEYNTQSNSVIVGHNEYSRNQFATALDVSGNVDVSGNITVTGNITIQGDITVDALNYNSINKAPPVSIDYSDITEDLSFNHKIEIMTNDNSLQTSSLTIHNDLSNNGTFGSSFVYDNSLSVTGSVVVVDASNTNYGSYTVYSKGDGSDSFMVGKSASHVFNIVNQSNVGVWMQLDGNSFISTSDERLKKDIEDLEEETDSIMKLRPVKFHWNYEEEDKEKHIGFIAQEVEELFPDLVEENTYPDGSTYKGVDKTKLIPHLVNEIKSIKKEIEELKK